MNERFLEVDDGLEHDVAFFGTHAAVLFHLRIHGGKRAFHVADFKLLDKEGNRLRHLFA